MVFHMDGLVSIVMPAYNGAKFIRQAIDSVIAQSYPCWELIVVDDGSTDATAAIVAAYHDPRIRYTYQENRGQAAALNRGLALAAGEFVTTLDVDDWLTEHSLRDRVEYLDKHPEHGVVYGDGYYCDVTGRLLMRFSEYRIGAITGDVYSTLIYSPFFGTGANVLVRRAVLDQHGIRYDESILWCQDYDFYIRIAAVTTFGTVATPIVWYRLHAANMTMSLARPRRFESLVATRCKVVQSPRFASLSDDEKVVFFQQVLQELYSREADQTLFVNSATFRTLPRRKQARTLRLTAYAYLIRREHVGFARRLLYRAWLLNPFEPRTALIFALAVLDPSLAGRAIRGWHALHSRAPVRKATPFEMANEAHSAHRPLEAQ